MFRNPLTDVIVVLVVVLLFFGPKRLPALGQGLREFKDSLTGGSHDEDEAERPSLTAAAAQPTSDPARRPAEREAAEPRS